METHRSVNDTGYRFFLCGGPPKSGTTFLQRTLNLHPNISCPSEQDFPTIVKYLKKFAEDYQTKLAILDRRTGGQGPPVIDKQVLERLIRSTIVTLSRAFAGNKPIHGFKENSVFNNLQFIHKALAFPPVIVIVRNPVDCALSAWRHNRRMAQDEPLKAAQHLALLDNPEGTLDGYVRKFAHIYVEHMASFLKYAQNRQDILIVHYENMKRDTAFELRRMVRFLGADESENVIQDVVRHSSKEEMAKTSSNPNFFGLNQSDGEDVSAVTRAEVLASHANILEALGYNMTPLLSADPME